MRVWATVIALGVTGCSQAFQTPLPELSSISRRLLSADEQKKAIEDMNLERERHEAEALKEIEHDGSRPSDKQP
jgi:hypothetical protein